MTKQEQLNSTVSMLRPLCGVSRAAFAAQAGLNVYDLYDLSRTKRKASKRLCERVEKALLKYYPFEYKALLQSLTQLEEASDETTNIFYNPEHEAWHDERSHKIAQQEINRLVPSIAKKEAARLYNERMDRLLADLQADLQTTIYAAFEDNKNVLLGQTTRAVLSDALFERVRNDVERLKITIE